MKDEGLIKRVLRFACNYMIFFLTVAFVITCCTMLFVSTLTDTLQITLTGDDLNAAAKLTFWNVALLSFVFYLIDRIRRKRTVERPVNAIVKAADALMQGDFSVRIEPPKSIGGDDAFARVIDCFNRMAEELGSVETLRTDFTTTVSHEMKTPLAVMRNYAALLQAPALSEEKRQEYASGIAHASKRLADMMTNILKLNRLENQQIFPQTTVFDLGEQLCECLLQYETVWEQAQIHIDTDFAENVNVKADAELLSLVWNNMFSNAFKFTPTGGTVSVSLTTTPHHAVVQVKDTGCGMSPQVGARIFEKFYQGDTSRSTEGNGLGLALVKRVIDILQGEIGVQSEVGVGTTFTVKIRRV